MEELKILIELIKDLPQTALYILLGYFLYKVLVVGSIFGLFRLFIVKLYGILSGLINKQNLKISKPFLNDNVERNFYGIMNEYFHKDKSSDYIHSSDIREIEEKLYEDK